MAYRILVVDDSAAMRAFMRRITEMSGLSVGQILEAEQGEQALDVLRAEWVDVVLTDINMPKMDGECFLKAVEGDDVLRSIPVVVVSTDSSGSRIQRMLALGAKGYICKPFAPETLRNELERVLGGNRGCPTNCGPAD